MSDVVDGYAATASAYDLYAAASRPLQVAAIEQLIPLLRPERGPILDVGAGSGANVALLLERLPAARVCALEPSPAMRSLILGRLAAHPEWFHRVSVRPEDFFFAPLPDRIGGALLLGVIGHFDPQERAAVIAELARRLPRGGAALLDLQDPQRPEVVPAYEFAVATIGDLSYRGIAEAWPVGGERMRWRMTYLTLEGERVLTEATTEHDYHHPGPEVLVAEAAQVGLRAERVGVGTHWLLIRP
ncbi:MAG: class I SAM-dependent methyltransferase [Propioniciclava sp.]|uniref:class I SAM-dependent methyltransferase n=1 Tax=Propioniciclava sp. TaxID=2038686 RepID=UPI0039E42368